MSNDTQTAATSPAADPSAASAPATTPAADPAPAATPAAAPPADPAQAPAATAPATDPAPQGEAYDLVAPEGTKFDDELIGELKTFAKDSKMPKEQAQKLAEMGQKAMQKAQDRMLAQFEQTQQQWVSDSRADKEFGGDNLSQNLAVAKRALDAFGTPELTKFLNESGLGNHPEIIRYNFRVAQTLSEDRVVPGSTKPGGPTNAQSFYGKSGMNP